MLNLYKTSIIKKKLKGGDGLRKLVAVLALLVIGMVVGVAGATAIKTSINFVGPGTVSNKMFVGYGRYVLSSEGTTVSSPYMTYTQTFTGDLSNIMRTVSSNVLKVSSTKDINFKSEIYMRRFFISEFSLNAANGSITYVTSSNHVSGNYTRDIVVSAEKASLINDLEETPFLIGHNFEAKGIMYDVYFNSSTSMLHNSKYRSVISNICFNIPYYNVSAGVPSFNGILTETAQVPVFSTVNTSVNVRSFSSSNVVRITRSRNPMMPSFTEEVDMVGTFNTLNSTTNFFSESVNLTVPSSFFP